MMSYTNRRAPHLTLALLFALVVAGFQATTAAAEPAPIRVVATLPDYGWAAQQIGGDRVEVHSIARGNQDAHFVRPRPSYTMLMRNADVFITTGLDLELWVPTLLDAAGNSKILEGSPGYVAAWQGIEMLDVPDTISRAQGDIHVFGNPHIHTDPLNMIRIARNIAAGLERVDPDHSDAYARGLKELTDRLHRRLFGDELVDLLGGDILARLSESGRLRTFLEERDYPRDSGELLIERLGGWMKQAEPLLGKTIIGYHKNWVYFTRRFGMTVAGHVETKPGIPPTPRHVETIIDLIRGEGIRVILSANYFDPAKPQVIAERTGAKVVVVPLSTGGEPGLDGYEDLIDAWISRLLTAFSVAGGK
jgi:zinc/manganese transport system substrate-binding protein